MAKIELNITKPEPAPIEFPGLYRFELKGTETGLIVCAFDNRTGIVVGGGTADKPVGFWYQSWLSFSHNAWKRIPGKVSFDLSS